MWLTVGESLRWMPFRCMIIMMHVVNFRDKQHKKILEEKEKTGQLGCAKAKTPDMKSTFKANSGER